MTGLEPPRVWKEDSIGGAMLLTLLTETDIAMAGYEMETRREAKVKKGRRYERECRHSTGSMLWSLGHLTVTRLIEK